MQSALVFLGLLALSQAGVPMSRGLSGRIINGDEVKPGEIPYQVSLQTRGIHFHFCGGSVLNKDFVITAAHCIEGTTADLMLVVAGSVNLYDSGSIHRVAKIIIHEKYNYANTWINDIALIKLKVPFEVSETLKYAALPKPGQVIPSGAAAVVSGWGMVSLQGTKPKILQRAEIQIVAQDYCQQVWEIINGTKIHDTQICAYDPKVETGSCMGDSGGPLTVAGELVGLVSWGRGVCANVEYPTVYTRISEYIHWIMENAV